MDMAGYAELRAEQAREAGPGELMGIGISFFTEAVGAGPRKHMDILGLGMADGAELRVHPTGKAVVRLSVQTQGQGHETTFAQIVAEELGIPPDDIDVVHGDTDQHAVRPRHLRFPVHAGVRCRGGRRGAEGPGQGQDRRAAMLEVSPDDLEWEKGRWFVKGDPEARAGPSRRSPWPRTATWSCPRASRATWTRRASTTRPT